MTNGNDKSWIDQLTDEDTGFIKRFVLASGSLKELAKTYDISYPTVRLRLDRLIEKIKLIDSNDFDSEFERTLRIKYAEGKLDRETFKIILSIHKKEMERSYEDISDSD